MFSFYLYSSARSRMRIQKTTKQNFLGDRNDDLRNSNKISRTICHFYFKFGKRNEENECNEQNYLTLILQKHPS